MGLQFSEQEEVERRAESLRDLERHRHAPAGKHEDDRVGDPHANQLIGKEPAGDRAVWKLRRSIHALSLSIDR